MAEWQITDGDFYVSKSGNDGNPGTQASPFLTIQRGLNAASSGQKIVVGAGDYPEQITGGSEILQADAEHQVVMD